MTVKKCNGNWSVDVRPNGAHGKRFRKEFKIKARAVAYEAWILENHRIDKDWEPTKYDNRKLSQLVKQWQELHGCKLRDPGRLRIVQILAAAVGDPVARLLTPQDFIRYANKRIEKGITPNTINHELSYLKAVYNKLISLDQWRHINPIAKVPNWKTADVELTYLSVKQMESLLVHCSGGINPHTALCVELCLDTGARWSEAEKIKTKQLANCRASYYNTKGGKPRSIPITEDLQKRLLAHAKKTDRKDGRVFGPCYDAFINALERSKLELPKGQASHVLRHSYASHFMINGGNIISLKTILGHSDIKMTMRYAHLAPDHMETALKLRPLRKP